MRTSDLIRGFTMGLLVLAITTGSAQSATRIVSGYLSGLNRGESVTLLQNGTDALTVTTNGIFEFATPLASGSSYEITIGTQPASEVCTVDAAESGIVPDAGVTAVEVSCGSSIGTAAAGSWWIPYTASPVPSTTGGKTGLFLIASDQIHSAPKQQFIVKTAAKSLAAGIDITSSGGMVGAQPGTLMYSAVGADGGTHIYGVHIDNTAALPKPTKITKLSLTSTQAICGSSSAQTSLTDATTLFIVINVSTTPCGTNPSTYYVIHFSDAATLTPKPLAISTTAITPLYENGLLVGLYLYNAPTQSLNFYATSAFTAPKQLVTSITNVSPIGDTASIADGTAFGATEFFPTVTGVTTSGTALYRIASGSPGTATLIHAGTVSDGVIDNANLYFLDTTSATASVFYQVGLTANTPMLIFSGAITPPSTSYSLIGSDTARLAFQQTQISTSQVTTINTIPTGVKSTTSTQIAGPYTNSTVFPFMAMPAAGDWTANKLFLTILQFTVGTPPTYAYSSTATALSATAPTPTNKTAYESFGAGGVWQAKGITDTDGGMGGATINEVNVTTLADSPLTKTGGGNFKIPAHYHAVLAELGSGGIAIGLLLGTTTTLPSIGLACDVTGKFIIEEKDTNTNILIF